MQNKFSILRLLFFSFFLFVGQSIVYSQSCNNWAQFPGQPAYVRVGDLDIPGNKITVEALINRTAPWNGIDLFQGDVVSKHEDPKDCNYLLRPSSAEITTNNGYFKTPVICPIELNKTYHVAFTYDGSALKFYRNGFLMSQIAATGNLILNNWQTQIGLYFNQTTQENFIGFINEVKIWNIVRTQDEIKSTMSTSLVNPQSIPGLLAYYTFDNLKNKQGNATWDGQIGGSASINKTNTSCNFVIDSCNIVPCQDILQADFDFIQDVCNPKIIRYTSTQDAMLNYDWDFGNGQKKNGQRSEQISYQDFGIYTVKLHIQARNGCKGTITKNVAVDLKQSDIIVTKDTTVCAGDGFLLRSSASLVDYCWQSSNGSINGKVNNPFVQPINNSVFTLTSKTLQTNLVINGDFSNGNSGFQSDYTYSANGVPEGIFYVGNNVSTWHSGLAACSDRVNGGGNQLMINGSGQKDIKVWYQTIKVQSHTNYVFSAWLQSLSPTSPAQLQFSINGNKIGNILNGGSQTCQWDQFYYTWNSGEQTTATIAIVNVNQAAMGNDFSLDDIYFGEVITETENIRVNVSDKPILQVSDDTLICAGNSALLQASGALQYQWQPSASLSALNIADPTASPLQTTRYIVTGTNREGCFQKDSVTVQVQPKPTFSVNPSSAFICSGDTLTLSVVGGDRFEWKPDSHLVLKDNRALVFPESNTTYHVNVKDKVCQVDETIAVSVGVKPLPPISITKTNDIDCSNTTAQLTANGGTNVQWLPVAGLTQTSNTLALVSPTKTTTYVATVIAADGCKAKDSITVLVSNTGINRFYVPNAFTPDGNGRNDCFGVPFWGNVDQFSLEIYNRWGQKVFSADNVTKCWDGKFKGQLQPEGLYIYIIKSKTFCGEVSKKGAVLLTR